MVWGSASETKIILAATVFFVVRDQVVRGAELLLLRGRTVVGLTGFRRIVAIAQRLARGTGLRGLLCVFFLLTMRISPLIDGNALIEKFVKRCGLWEKYQRLFDIVMKTFVKHG